MPSKRTDNFHLFGRLIALLLTGFILAGCGSDPKEPPLSGESDPAFSMPLPKGIWAPLPGSDLVMTARAVIDPGTPGARTADLAVDLSTSRVTGAIEGVSAGPHTVEIQYFINQVQVAAVTLNVDVVPGQNNPVQIAPAAIRYVEKVADALFVADGQTIKIFDRYSNLKGGVIQPAPTRTLQGENTGIVGPSPGSLFVDSIGGGLYFADAQADSVSVWNNAATVNGDTPPDRVLKGAATRLLQPTGIAVDPFRDRLYVVNNNGEILIWNGLSSLEGEVPPIAVFVGSLIAGDHPVFLDVKRDMLYVVNGGGINVFEKLSGLTVQNGAPIPMIRIAGKDLSRAALAGDSIGDLLYVSSRDANGTIHRIAAVSAASEEVVPAATLAGPETGLNQTSAVALAGKVLMALHRGGNEIRVWHQADQKDGDASPTQILELDPNSLPMALFYVATQNAERDQKQAALDVTKSGSDRGSVTSDLPGINCGTTCSALFAIGSEVVLTAAADTGSTFLGWEGACSGTDPSCSVRMDAVRSVTATFHTNQTPPIQGLVAAYAMSEGSGDTTADASGNLHTGTLVNGPLWSAQGKFGNALSFDGANDFVSVADHATLDLGSAGTLEAWIVLNTLDRWHGVIAKGNANSNTAHNYALEITDANRVRCILGNGGSAVTVDSTVTMAANQLRHLACSWNGATLSLYFDGALNASTAQTLTPAGNAARLFIGQFGGGADRLSGIIDEVRIYNRALTQNEIQQDMNTPIAESLPFDTTAQQP